MKYSDLYLSSTHWARWVGLKKYKKTSTILAVIGLKIFLLNMKFHTNLQCFTFPAPPFLHSFPTPPPPHIHQMYGYNTYLNPLIYALCVEFVKAGENSELFIVHKFAHTDVALLHGILGFHPFGTIATVDLGAA